MKSKSIILFYFLCFSLMANAQFSDMMVTGIEKVGKDDSGPVNKLNHRPWALFLFDVEDRDDSEINGSKIVPIQQNNVKLPYPEDKKYDAYAGASGRYVAKAITLHHANFNNCKIEFKDYLGENQLEEGMVYKIKLKLPSVLLIEANAAYSDLEFRKAAKLFSEIVSDPNGNREEKIIASNQLQNIDSLISFRDSALRYESLAADLVGKARDRSLYRSRIFYDRIYKKTGLVNAISKVENINEILHIDKKTPVFNLNKIKMVGAEMIGNDMRASGNDVVKYEYIDSKNRSQTGKAALIIIDIPVNDVVVESPLMVGKTEVKNGETWFYARTDKDKEKDVKALTFTLKHPDFADFEFPASDLFLEPEKVYRITLDCPSLIMKMANNKLANLDLLGAEPLFNYNYEDADEQDYAERCRGFLQSPAVSRLIRELDAKVKKCRSTEKEYYSIITGLKQFDDIETRTNQLNKINKQLAIEAGTMARDYSILYNEADRYGITLWQANYLANEYSNIENGVRRLPIIIELMEIKEDKDFFSRVYTPAEKITSSPTVLVEISNKGKTVFSTHQKVKDGKISFLLNIDGTNLFRQGAGKIKISTPEKMNDKKNKYEDTELEIRDLKISDYSTKKMNVTLLKSN